MAQQTKFCPKCGKPAKATDAYCIKCGYNFSSRKKRKNILLIVILIALALWVGIRMFSGKPIIPEQITEFVKGFLNRSNSTG